MIKDEIAGIGVRVLTFSERRLIQKALSAQRTEEADRLYGQLHDVMIVLVKRA